MAYGRKSAAEESSAFFIDLNELVATQYEELGKITVQEFFTTDHTHTNALGAKLNAQTVATAIRNRRDCSLRGYMEINKN
jgi:lysophospholipase L1-like esterase